MMGRLLFVSVLLLLLPIGWAWTGSTVFLASKTISKKESKETIPRRKTSIRLQSAPRQSSEPHTASSSSSNHGTYLATCVPGLSTVLEQELQELGCIDTQVSGRSAVYFGVPTGATILHVLIYSRVAMKLMELLVSSSQETIIQTRHDLYDFCRDTLPVQELLYNAVCEQWRTLSVQAVLNQPQYLPNDLTHSHYTALNVKNALIDAAREFDKGNRRPNINVQDADVPLVVVVRPSQRQNTAAVSVYRTVHTGSLHKRGYRRDSTVHKAALKETTAAGLLQLTKQWWWNDVAMKPLLDPMCGSGTLLIEGALMAADIAPHLIRIRNNVPGAKRPPIVRWGDDDNDSENMETLWRQQLTTAALRARRGLEAAQNSTIILGNDAHPSAIQLAKQSIQQAGLSQLNIQLSCGECADWDPFTVVKKDDTLLSSHPWLVVSNPPWGVRLDEEMEESWEQLRSFLRETCPANTNAWILSGSKTATKHLGLKRSASVPLRTAQQDLRFLQYVIHDKKAAGAFSSSRRNNNDNDG